MTDHDDLSAVNAESFQKFTPQGFARKFPGLSVVHFINPESKLFDALSTLLVRMQEDFTEYGLIDKFVFVPKETYHITILDIALRPGEKVMSDIIRGTEMFFQELQNEKPHPATYIFSGCPSFTNKETLIVRTETADAESRRIIEQLRNTLHITLTEIVGENVISPLREYRGHLTLAYIIEPLSENESATFQNIMDKYNTNVPLGDMVVDTVELRKFESMEDWGQQPLARIKLA